MNPIEVLVPVAATRVVLRPLARRLTQLAGARIGWLDNQKANAGELLRQLAVLLRTGIDFELVHLAKNATAAAPDAIMAHLKRCDAVVLAIAD